MKHSTERHQFPLNSLNQVSFRKTSNRLSVQQKAPLAETGNEIWFLTLSDLLMLLMICFVLLFGITIQQQNKNINSQSVPVEKVMPVKKIVEIPPALTTTADLSIGDATASLESDLLAILNDNKALPGITVERQSRYIVLTFPEQIIFDSGQSQLKPAVQPLLEKVTVFIQNHSELLIEIQGHTDDRPINNQRYPSNWELSADRATQVAKALVQFGIDPTRLSTKGFGEYHPLYPNDSDANRFKNRRVELKFSLSEST